jgi:hypothetical protein
MEDIIKGIIIGFLAGFIVLYSLQPHVKNPDWLMIIYENPLILLIMLILVYYIMRWNIIIGYLLLIVIIGIYLDIILIIKKTH